jgi:hypothetical protein
MSLEMPDVETEAQKKQRKKAAQAAAHKRWRESEKGKAYLQRQKEKKALSK